MKYKIKESSVLMPGGWHFNQDGPKPHYFKGDSHKFAKDAASALHAFRTANNLPRSSYDECFEDVVDYNGEIRGGDAQWFRLIPGGTTSQRFSPPPSTGCKGCGARITSE